MHVYSPFVYLPLDIKTFFMTALFFCWCHHFKARCGKLVYIYVLLLNMVLMLPFACCIHKKIDLIENKSWSMWYQRYIIHVYLRKFKIRQNFDPNTCRNICPRTINSCTKFFFPKYSFHIRKFCKFLEKSRDFSIIKWLSHLKWLFKMTIYDKNANRGEGARIANHS